MLIMLLQCNKGMSLSHVFRHTQCEVRSEGKPSVGGQDKRGMTSLTILLHNFGQLCYFAKPKK